MHTSVKFEIYDERITRNGFGLFQILRRVKVSLDAIWNATTSLCPIVEAIIALIAVAPGVVWTVLMGTIGCLCPWASFEVALGTFAEGIMFLILVRAVCVLFYFLFAVV